MSKKHVHIGTEDAERGFRRFIDAWDRAEKGTLSETEVHLNFEDLNSLLAILTPRKLEVLRALHKQPMSIRALSKALERDYKNVHADVRALENVELRHRGDDGLFYAPWDVIDAHVDLVA